MPMANRSWDRMSSAAAQQTTSPVAISSPRLTFRLAPWLVTFRIRWAFGWRSSKERITATLSSFDASSKMMSSSAERDCDRIASRHSVRYRAWLKFGRTTVSLSIAGTGLDGPWASGSRDEEIGSPTCEIGLLTGLTCRTPRPRVLYPATPRLDPVQLQILNSAIRREVAYHIYRHDR